jgi:stage III sporulation protein AE
MGFIMVLYSAVVAYQNIIGVSSDSLTVRTVRFAVGNSVPVIGASLGEAMRSVAGALSSLKGTVGGVGISVILLLVLPCVLSLLLERSAICAAGSICGVFGLSREAKLLDGVASAYGYASALVVCASVMLIFLLSIVSSVAVNIGAV